MTRVFIIDIEAHSHYIARAVRHLAQVLVEQGYEVTLFTTADVPALTSLAQTGVTTLLSRSSLRDSARLARRRIPLVWLEAFGLAWRRADVLIAVDAPGFVPAVAIKMIKPTTTLIGLFLNLITSFEHGPSVGLRVLERWASRMDLMTSANESTLYIRRAWLRTACPGVVLLNSPLEFTGPAPRAEHERQDSRLRLVYQGSIRAREGIHQLLQAMHSCAGIAHLSIMGFVENGYEALMRETPGVEYLGVVDSDTMMEVTRTCDVGVVLLPFRDVGVDLGTVFGAPQKLQEYMACGLPVLCSDNPSLREVEREGWGICVPAEEPEPIAEAIKTLAADRALVARMGTRAQHLFETKYNFRTQAQGFLRLLKQIRPPAT